MKVSIPNHCHEPWDGMSNCGSNKHCEACKTVVIDFTRMSDAEICQFLEERSGQHICGRFTSSQLNRPLRTSSASWIRPLAAAAIPTVMMLGMNEATAQVPEQEINEAPQTEQVDVADQVTIKGSVIDKHSGEALIGANIILKGSKIGTTADVYGQFSLVVERAELRKHPVVAVSFIGYERQEITVDPDGPARLELQLETNAVILGFVTYTGSTPEQRPQLKMEVIKQPKKLIEQK